MGMAYLLMLIVYIGVSVGIYKLVTKPTSKRWIKGAVIAFFVLLPTYDIIITKALLFYYCNYTEKEKVYKTVENPESVYFEDAIPVLKPTPKYMKTYVLENYLQQISSLKFVELYNGQNSILHYELDNNGDIVTKELKEPTACYHVYRRVLHINGFADSFLHTRGVLIKDAKTNKIIADLKTYNAHYYNIAVIRSTGGLAMKEGCGNKIYAKENLILKNELTKGVTNGNK
jgi:hypothetical protein